MKKEKRKEKKRKDMKRKEKKKGSAWNWSLYKNVKFVKAYVNGQGSCKDFFLCINLKRIGSIFSSAR